MGKAWIKGRKHDRYYRAAKRQGYRSRAAIKLSQIDDRYAVFHERDVVVDLGAAPGGWSQVARERIGPRGRVIALDFDTIAPIDGVEALRGDFSHPDVQVRLFEILGKPADVVMSDMAPRLSGTRPYDVARSLELADVALAFAERALTPGGTFLAKVFQGEGYRELVARVRGSFEAVKAVKPRASAGSSAEIYVLAKGRL